MILAKRHKALIAATALLMVGAGCVSAVKTTGDQLSHDALQPITVPVEAYKKAVEAASSTDALRRNQLEQGGFEAE